MGKLVRSEPLCTVSFVTANWRALYAGRRWSALALPRACANARCASWRSKPTLARKPLEPQAAGELRYFEERLLWSFERTRERQDLNAPYEPEAVPAVEASSCELARDDRRLHPRFAVEKLRGLRAVRIPLGPLVSLVDMSAGGALIESDQPLRPGAEARLELASKLSSNALCQESRAITGLEKHAYKGSIPSRLTIKQVRPPSAAPATPRRPRRGTPPALRRGEPARAEGSR
jgi:hypothetical protein